MPVRPALYVTISSLSQLYKLLCLKSHFEVTAAASPPELASRRGYAAPWSLDN